MGLVIYVGASPTGEYVRDGDRIIFAPKGQAILVSDATEANLLAQGDYAPGIDGSPVAVLDPPADVRRVHVDVQSKGYGQAVVYDPSAPSGFRLEGTGSPGRGALKDVHVDPDVPLGGFDQVGIPGQPQADGGTSTITFVYPPRTYAGDGALRCAVTHNGPGNGTGYARGILENPTTGPDAFREGSEVWMGAALNPEPGFYAAKTGTADLLRLDSFVDDDGALRPTAVQQFVALEVFRRDTVHLVANDRQGDVQDLSPGLHAPTMIPEGVWSMVEVHMVLSTVDGEALTELWIDGERVAASTRANLYAGRARPNRVRGGIVSTGPGETGDFAVLLDRLYFARTRQGQLHRADSARHVPQGEPHPPEGSTLQTLPRTVSSTVNVVSGRVQLCGPLVLPVGGITRGARFVSNFEGSTSLTNSWAMLVRQRDRQVLAVSQDYGAAPWAPNTVRDFEWATRYVADYPEALMVGLVQVGSGPAPLRGVKVATGLAGLPPILCASANNGLTNPASAPAVLSSYTPESDLPWAALY